jgi:O-antigen/teichoic acid export membrane protein
MAVFPAAEEPAQPDIGPQGRKAAPSARLREAFGRLLTILSGHDGHSRAQRMALTAFAIRLLSAAIAFVSQIILARMMGNFEYGIFVFIWVMVILAGNLSCFGFHAAQIRFLPQYETAGQRAEIRGLTTTARIFALLSASMVAFVGFLLLSRFENSVEPYYVAPLFVAFLILPMVALGDIMEGTARAHSWGIVALSPTYLVRPMLILGFMALAVYYGAPATAETAMETSLVATYVTTVAQFFNINYRLRRHHKAGPMAIDFPTWFRLAVPLFLIEGFSFLLTNADVVVVGLFLEPGDVAVYFAAAKTMAIIQFVYFSVKAASAPRFSAMMAVDDRQALGRFAGQTVRWVFWPSLLVGLAVLAAGPWLLAMFGPGFAAGIDLMAILFAGIMTKASVGPGEVLLAMAGHQGLCVRLYAAALGVGIVLNVILIPVLGLEGAALAAAGAMLTEAILLHIFVRRRLGVVMFAFADPLPAHQRPKAT